MRLAAALALALAACRPSNVAPAPDASDASTTIVAFDDGGVVSVDVGAACKNLDDLGFPEGADPTCRRNLSIAPSTGHATTSAIACMQLAKTRSQACACAPEFLCPR